MNQNTKTFLRISLLSVIFVSQLNTIAAVIMADLSKLFPDASPTAIQMVMQFGMIGAFPVMLSVGFLAQRFRIKPMICVGLCGIAVGGALPFAFHNSLVQLYVSAVIIGAGQGCIEPLVNTLTLRNFEGQPRARQIGLNSTFGTGGAAIVTVLAGVIALQGWLNIFYIYLLAIPMLIVTLIFMPMGEKPVRAAKVRKDKTPLPVRVFVQAGILIICFIAYVTYPINVGMLVDDQGIGDSAAVGVAVSLITVVGALFGLIFPYVVRFAKTYILSFSAAFGVFGLLMAGFAANIAMIYISAVLLGFYFGSAVAGAYYIIGRMCKHEQFGPSISINLSFLTIGVVLSPIIVNGVTPLWGGAGSEGAFMTAAGIMGVALVFSVIWGVYIRRNFPESATTPGEETEAAGA